jgi:flagellar hook protein FlgE
MFDSIHIGTSGLQTFAENLKVISNNVANMNTAGFKASESMFASRYYSSPGDGAGHLAAGSAQFGAGVVLGQTVLDLTAGEVRQTGNPLDLSVNGEGFFITRKADDGDAIYTRAGQFEFDKDGLLVVRGSGRQVVGLDAAGEQTSISLDGLRINPPRSTTQVTMSGNLSSSMTSFSIASFKVIDAAGGEHTLKLDFAPKSGAAGTWTVKLMDGLTEAGVGEIQFASGSPKPGFDSLDFVYSPTGVMPMSIKVDFSSNVTSFDMGSTSTLAVASTDGYAVGTLNKISFDTDGTMSLGYSNGQTAKGARLALAMFDSPAQVRSEGGSDFSFAGIQGLHVGAAGQGSFGTIGSSQIEGSNVDLASEFSDLIVAQRGYQASSRIVSTANELLQDLFDMKGHR